MRVRSSRRVQMMRSKGSKCQQNAVFCYCYHDSCNQFLFSPISFLLFLRFSSSAAAVCSISCCSVCLDSDHDAAPMKCIAQNVNTFLICYYLLVVCFACASHHSPSVSRSIVHFRALLFSPGIVAGDDDVCRFGVERAMCRFIAVCDWKRNKCQRNASADDPADDL